MSGARNRRQGTASKASGWTQASIATAVGLIYWTSFSGIVTAKEPWDGPYYWSVAYPASIAMALALGLVFRRRAWITGPGLTFAQLPIIVANTGIGLFLVFAAALLALLSVPLILAAKLTSMRR